MNWVSPPQSSGTTSCAGEFALDPLDIDAFLVDLVDRNDEGHFRRLGVLYGFQSLRLDAVIRGDHQYDHIGGPGAAGTHGGEGGMTRSIQKTNQAGFRFDVIGARYVV